MNISHVGHGKVVLLSGGGKVYTDIAARFVGSERSLDDIIASPYNKKIVQNILDSGHLAASEMDYFIFGIEGYSRVTEVQLVRKRLASYLIKSGRVNKNGKRSYDVVIPKSIEDVHTNLPLNTKHIYLTNGQSLYNHLNSFSQKLFNRKLDINSVEMRVGTLQLLDWLESWYNSGVEKGVPEEDLRYMKGQCTEWKGVFACNCYDKETEVLTDQGWKYFDTLDGTERFYSLNKYHNIDLLYATKVIKKKYTGEMVKVLTRSIDLLVTPEHKHYITYDHNHNGKNRNSDSWKLDNISDVINRKEVTIKKNCNPINGKSQASIILPEYKELVKKSWGKGYKEWIYPQQEINIFDFFRLLGYYLGDGSLEHQKGNYGIVLSDDNLDKLNFYKDLINKFSPNKARISKNTTCLRLTVINRNLYELFKDFGNVKTKKIPLFCWEYDHKILEQLYYGMLDSDGCVIAKTNHATYSTISKDLADDFQRLVLHIGYSGKIQIVDRRGNTTQGFDSRGKPYKITAKHIEYRISVNKQKNEPKIKHAKQNPFSKKDYDDFVYCVSLPINHTLYVRRNGVACWSGNCHGLLDWFKIRCCLSAQHGIRDLANKILKLCKDASPDLFQNAGANCISLGYCPENERQHKNCIGKIPTHKDVLNLIKER